MGSGDPTGKSISVSVRACVRAVAVRWESAEIAIPDFSLFPFGSLAFPFSLFGSLGFPLPPTSYPASAGFIGMYAHLLG